MADHFDILLLLALPASGKSEVRNFLTEHDPTRFHMAPTVQLDDYPYVHLQIRVDEVLSGLGKPRVYHRADEAGQANGPFYDHREFNGLIRLLDEDYQAFREGKVVIPERPANHLLTRFDAASEAVGARPKFKDMPEDVVEQIGLALHEEALDHYQELARACPETLDDKTLVIEFARGGPPGDSMPLPEGYGYAASLPQLSKHLLDRAAILYIWVTPEESRRKNRERARPDGDGSILFHGTPESVMRQEYSRCDMKHLLDTSSVPGAIQIEAHGETLAIPTAFFDNRDDLTTFLREDASQWKKEDVDKIDGRLKTTCDQLWDAYEKIVRAR